MAVIKLRHVERFKDRHGTIRYYYRVGKGARIALKGEPGTEEFHQSYQEAASRRGNVKSDAKTFDNLARLYFNSIQFKSQKQISRDVLRRAIQRFLNAHGKRLVTQMTRLHVNQLVAQKSETPSAANELLKLLKILIHYAIDLDWTLYDPTIRIKKFKVGTHHTWDEEEVAQFERYWPLGSRERTAFALHLYTGQRRADVCKMQPSDIIDGKRIRVAQQKSETHAEPVTLLIKIHPNLREALDAWTVNGDRIISSDRRTRYNVGAYGNMMADAIEEAGLPERCVLHGLRKAAARRLAEAGCTPHQIMAITGHKTLGEVERYTRAVAQKGLADSAIDGLGRAPKD